MSFDSLKVNSIKLKMNAIIYSSYRFHYHNEEGEFKYQANFFHDIFNILGYLPFICVVPGCLKFLMTYIEDEESIPFVCDKKFLRTIVRIRAIGIILGFGFLLMLVDILLIPINLPRLMDEMPKLLKKLKKEGKNDTEFFIKAYNDLEKAVKKKNKTTK